MCDAHSNDDDVARLVGGKSGEIGITRRIKGLPYRSM